MGQTYNKKQYVESKSDNEIKKRPNTPFGAGMVFFLILAQTVYKMWIIQEPNMLELWNRLHFEDEKTESVYTMFKIFSTYICWINI